MKLRYKTSMLIFVFGTIVLIVLSMVILSLNKETLTNQNLAALRQNSQLIADHLETRLLEKAQLSVAISLADQIREALIESNAVYANMLPEERTNKIERLNQQWMATSDVNDLFVQSYMTNPAAQYLNYQQESFPGLFGEIFLTNRYGGTVATTGKLTTWAHAEKYWWQASYFDGEGKIFFDDSGFDNSVDGYVLGIVVPVRDGDEVIGLLKFNFNILELLSITLEEYLNQYQGNIQIARTGGSVVLEKGGEPLSTKLDAEVLELLASKENDVEFINGQEQMVGYAPVHITMGSDTYSFGGRFSSIANIKGNQGEAWHIVITEPSPTLLNNSEEYLQSVFLVSVIVVSLTSISAFLSTFWLSKPIEEMAAAAEELGAGNLSVRVDIKTKDELGTLATSFNEMADQLQSLTTGLEEKVQERTEEIERSNRDLQNFAYIASHDLQEPLRMVTSYLQLLKRRYGAEFDADALQFMDYAYDGATRMRVLIQDLLEYSRVQSDGGAFDLVDCEAVLQDTLFSLKVLIEENQAKITNDPLPEIKVDKKQFEQLCQNLISNAIKFKQDDRPRIHISARHVESGWEFSVADNGIGIASEHAEKIFEIFRRLHSREEYEGTGIGLAICKRIVERHGGRIWAEPGGVEGTVFKFIIPDEPEEVPGVGFL